MLIIHLQLHVPGYISKDEIYDTEFRILMGNKRVQFCDRPTVLKVNIYFSPTVRHKGWGFVTGKWDCYGDVDFLVQTGYPHITN